MNNLSIQKFKRSFQAFAAYGVKRFRGEQYGRVVLNGGEKVRIVPTADLQRFLQDIEHFGYPKNGAISPLSQAQTDELIRLVSPIIKSDKNIAPAEYTYSRTPGRMSVYDKTNTKLKLLILENVKSPTKDFVNYLFRPITDKLQKFMLR